MARPIRSLALVLMVISALSYAKKAELVMMWPQDNPTLKLTYMKKHWDTEYYKHAEATCGVGTRGSIGLLLRLARTIFDKPTFRRRKISSGAQI